MQAGCVPQQVLHLYGASIDDLAIRCAVRVCQVGCHHWKVLSNAVVEAHLPLLCQHQNCGSCTAEETGQEGRQCVMRASPSRAVIGWCLTMLLLRPECLGPAGTSTLAEVQQTGARHWAGMKSLGSPMSSSCCASMGMSAEVSAEKECLEFILDSCKWHCLRCRAVLGGVVAAPYSREHAAVGCIVR